MGKTVTDLFTGDNSQYVDDNNVYIPIERLRTLNPAISVDADYYQISKLIYSGLFKFDENIVPQPDLVQSYKYAEDKKSIEIILRDDVIWHDEEKFDSEDVKFTIDAYISLAKTNSTIYSSYVSNIKSVKLDKNDPYKVTIQFGSDKNIAVENLVFPILPAHSFRNAAAVKNTDNSFVPVGTGPYSFVSYDSLNNLVLEGNQDYYGEKAENTLIFQIFPDKRDGISMIGINDISIIYDTEYDRSTLIGNNELSVHNHPSNTTEVLGFNFKNRHMAEKNVRQAVACAIDNSAVLETVYYRNGIETDSIIYPQYFGNENRGESYPFDRNAGIKLLKAAGYEDYDRDGYIENSEDEEIEIVFLVNDSDSLKKIAAQMIKSNIEKLGITVTIDFAQPDDFAARLASGSFDMFLGSCTVNERYDLRDLLHSEYGNVLSYSNTKVDEFVTDMVSGISQREKAETVSKLKGILIDEIPYYPLFCKTNGFAYTDSFRGEPAPVFNNVYHGCEKWYCSYEAPQEE